MSLSIEDVISIIQEYKGDTPDWIEKHGSWSLTIVGLASACMGTLFAYFLKSRCKNFFFCGLECDREVMVLDPKDPTINSIEQVP